MSGLKSVRLDGREYVIRDLTNKQVRLFLAAGFCGEEYRALYREHLRRKLH